MASFLEAQLGFAAESTYGTRVTSTRFLPFVSESLDYNIDYLQSASYRAGRIGMALERPGAKRVTGDVTMELQPQGAGLWLKHCLGAVSTTGAGPYVHTITPTATTGLSLSAQIVRTDDGGTARPFDYSGLKVTGWDLSAQLGGFVTLKTSLYGTAEVTNQSTASQSLPANGLPFIFTEASVTVGGTACPVMGFDLKADNGLSVDRQRLGNALSKEPIQKSIRTYEGSLDADLARSRSTTSTRRRRSPRSCSRSNRRPIRWSSRWRSSSKAKRRTRQASATRSARRSRSAASTPHRTPGSSRPY